MKTIHENCGTGFFNDQDTLKCFDCGKLTTGIEANLRLFRNELCGYCGGQLGKLIKKDPNDLK
jgi:hypothetical protein